MAISYRLTAGRNLDTAAQTGFEVEAAFRRGRHSCKGLGKEKKNFVGFLSGIKRFLKLVKRTVSRDFNYLKVL
jgi:hypothetical protein